MLATRTDDSPLPDRSVADSSSNSSRGAPGTVLISNRESVAVAVPALSEEQARAAASIESTDFVVDDRSAARKDAAISASRYLIQSEIARGGVGIIYSAIDKTLGREVALKVLQATHREKADIHRRFSEEAHITSALHHPGVVPIYDFGVLPDRQPFIAMGLVQGQTLVQMLAARQKADEDLPKYLGIFEKVCQTLAYAHSRGIIHRDLKPGNIMVSPFGAVNVMDWGVAKALSNTTFSDAPGSHPEDTPVDDAASSEKKKFGTVLGSVMGTLAYMAPEQASGQNQLVDKRADVFGLGGILCEILTGHPPYVGNDTASVHQMAKSADLEAAFARLTSSGNEHPLTQLAKRCLAANREDRFADAGELAAALTNYLESLLRRAEMDLVRFFELSMDLFCIAGFDGVFHRINSNFSKVLGYADREFLTRPFLDFVHPDDRERTIAEMEKQTHGLPVIQFRNRYRDVRGDYHWLEWTAKSIIEEQVIFAVARDVTERVKQEERRPAE